MTDSSKRSPGPGEPGFVERRRNPYKAPSKNWHAAEPFFDLRLSHFVEVILTLALLAVGASQIWIYWRQTTIMDKQADIARQANVMNAESSRAWLAPTVIGLGQALERGKPVDLTVQYTNPGHEPALHVNSAWRAVMFPYNSDSHVVASEITPFDTCDSVHDDIGAVMYPTGGSNVYPLHFALNQSDIDYKIPFRLTRNFNASGRSAATDVLNKAYVLSVNGCFGYTTAGKRRYSRFCYFLQPDDTKPPEQWNFLSCTTGNEAD